MNNSLQVFSNNTFSARTIQDEQGIIWFVAKDIAQALDYPGNTIKQVNNLCGNVPDMWKGHKRIMTPGGEQDMLCLSEQGLYFFLGRSDKPKALPYQIWVAGEVVPSIMRNGFYATPQAAQRIINDPETFIAVLKELKSLQEQAEINRPKVIFAEAVNSSNDSILIGNLAKLLRQNGIKIGQNRLFAWFRENGWLIRKRGAMWNMPTQQSMEKGYFTLKKSIVNNPDGTTKILHTTKVTGKGQVYFINLFLNMKGEN